MPVYVAVPLLKDIQPLKNALEQTLSSDSYYQLQADSGYLINFSGTTIELSNHIGITGQAEGELPTVGSCLIVPVTNYYGRGPTNMWEWIKTRIESE
jgi:hypothetical protein